MLRLTAISFLDLPGRVPGDGLQYPILLTNDLLIQSLNLFVYEEYALFLTAYHFLSRFISRAQ